MQQVIMVYVTIVESHPFCTTLDLQLYFYPPLCYKRRAHCHLLQCLHTSGAILADAHSYFVVSYVRTKNKYINKMYGLWNPGVQCRIHRGSAIVPILSRINLIPLIDIHFLEIHPIIVLPSMLPRAS